MSIEPMPVANTVQLNSMRKFFLHNSDILINFCLLASGPCLSFYDMRIGIYYFDRSEFFLSWAIKLYCDCLFLQT